jgi:NADH dehydrogenase (ubiquinone) 1 beta subcomplex subunit 3
LSVPPLVMPEPLYRDPWAKREAWRKHPIFSTRNMFKSTLPGFGIAVVAFAAYVAAEKLVLPEKKEDHH